MTHTTISELQIGDRFYKSKDAKKRVHEKIKHEPFKTKHYNYTNWALPDGERHAVMFKNDTPVVFLRSTKNGQTKH